MLKNMMALTLLSALAPAALADQPATFYAGADTGRTRVTDSGDGVALSGNKTSYGAFLG
ncbi:hypothetical protein Jab_1c21580 [Janthinobacterium sp. HH01]|uniref:hypothetical protein n=1 Tax=Janthinobacterium sp. HH01 TaxID=1198452 RepID=UPI0002AEA1D5|nr:hypothetical protein [Janthinobacterium sp. HH01]ELX13523.1 hypothetical protein Jab_1c21580 [Janthinobacterium sp. HH01]